MAQRVLHNLTGILGGRREGHLRRGPHFGEGVQGAGSDPGGGARLVRKGVRKEPAGEPAESGQTPRRAPCGLQLCPSGHDQSLGG